MNYNTNWTPELIEKLRALWEEGHSTPEIGRRMNMSKNSCIGKAHRLGLTVRPSPIKRGVPKLLPPDRAGRVTLPQLVSQCIEPPSSDTGSTAPAAWLAWCDQLPHTAFNAIRRAPHKSDCPVIHQRMSLRLWECTCGVSQPGSEVVVSAKRQVVSKPVGRAIVRAAVPEPEEIVPLTIFKPRRSEPCCWPTGHGRSIVFCEEIAEPGRPYCKNCAAKAYTKVRNWGFDDAKGDQPAV